MRISTLIITGFTLAAIATPAVSAPLDLSAVVKYEGTPVQDQFATGNQTPGKTCADEGEKPCLTVARAVFHAMLLCVGPPLCPKEAPDGEAKYNRSKWADALDANPKAVDMGDEERAVARGVVGEMYNPVVVRAVWDAIQK